MIQQLRVGYLVQLVIGKVLSWHKLEQLISDEVIWLVGAHAREQVFLMARFSGQRVFLRVSLACDHHARRILV